MILAWRDGIGMVVWLGHSVDIVRTGSDQCGSFSDDITVCLTFASNGLRGSPRPNRPK